MFLKFLEVFLFFRFFRLFHLLTILVWQHVSIQAQQCSSSAAEKGWRFVPQWVPKRTPTVHWGLNSRKAVGGPFGSDSRYMANMVAEQVVKSR